MTFILAQICGGIALVLMVVCVQFKDKSKIVILNTFSNLVIVVEYFLLGATTGAIVSILNAVRCIVFYFYAKKGLKPSIPVLIAFELMSMGCGILSWQNAWSIIPIVISCLYTYGIWQDNVFVVKVFVGLAGLGWTGYNLIVRAYVGAIQQFAQFVSAVVAVIRMKIKKKNVDVVEKDDANEKPENK